mmetsp:Transcript_507/g.942  ORF Transcript_507/g.942 Transcript_507/m.942 type:complete len:326 (-) Transcript_507:670-1647(-)
MLPLQLLFLSLAMRVSCTQLFMSTGKIRHHLLDMLVLRLMLPLLDRRNASCLQQCVHPSKILRHSFKQLDTRTIFAHNVVIDACRKFIDGSLRLFLQFRQIFTFLVQFLRQLVERCYLVIQLLLGLGQRLNLDLFLLTPLLRLAVPCVCLVQLLLDTLLFSRFRRDLLREVRSGAQNARLTRHMQIAQRAQHLLTVRRLFNGILRRWRQQRFQTSALSRCRHQHIVQRRSVQFLHGIRSRGQAKLVVERSLNQRTRLKNLIQIAIHAVSTQRGRIHRAMHMRRRRRSLGLQVHRKFQIHFMRALQQSIPVSAIGAHIPVQRLSRQ